VQREQGKKPTVHYTCVHVVILFWCSEVMDCVSLLFHVAREFRFNKTMAGMFPMQAMFYFLTNIIFVQNMDYLID